jgi:hypothetical protein
MGLDILQPITKRRRSRLWKLDSGHEPVFGLRDSGRLGLLRLSIGLRLLLLGLWLGLMLRLCLWWFLLVTTLVLIAVLGLLFDVPLLARLVLIAHRTLFARLALLVLGRASTTTSAIVASSTFVALGIIRFGALRLIL